MRRHSSPAARLAIALLAASTAGTALHAAAAAGADTPAGTSTVQAFFRCDAGKTLDAVFANGTPASVALALSDGRHVALPQARSASGARYANGDESFVFWNKGDTAFIEENGKATYSGCATRR